MNMDQLLQTFIAECGELLEDMESSLLRIENSGATPEAINAIFRTAHTIKGSGGLFGLAPLVRFTHVAENLLDHLRKGNLEITPPLIALLLQCNDHLRLLVKAVASNTLDDDSEVVKAGLPLIQQLQSFLPAGTSEPELTMVTLSAAASDSPATEAPPAEDLWQIQVRFGKDIFRGGTSILSLVRSLEALGTLLDLNTDTSSVPALDEIDPESCYLNLNVTLLSPAKRVVIEEVFEFIADECELLIQPSQREIGEQIRCLESLPDTEQKLGEMLLQAGVVSPQRLKSALAAQAASADKRPLGSVLIEKAAVAPAIIEAALAKQQRVRTRRAAKERKPVAAAEEAPKPAETRSVRVDADKLDYMINLVGELITAAAGADLAAKRGALAAIQESTSNLLGLVELVRESALRLRMVKIGATFARFQRVVHDVSRELGKDIQLLVSGEDAELDKTVVEKIADPLTHLVRNSMDHGIESAAVRKARGKPERGTVKLNAFHDSGSIVIEVSDDGGGLSRERIFQKAVERGLIDGNQTLNDGDLFNLIFEPGFSTAEKVTNLSGRGVGMDVVKRNITALRGSVTIRSEEGSGTTVSIRLPLTLAIINGFLVGVAGAVYVIPLDCIEECVRLNTDSARGYLNLRGEVLPLIRLADALDLAQTDQSRRESVVVVRVGMQKAGLVVDRLLGEFQTVIKPLGPLFRDQRCIAGFTVLGSGDVSLILDVPALLEEARGTPSSDGKSSIAAAA